MPGRSARTRYVFGFNAMDRTCNDLPFRSHLDPDATLLLPTRSIGKSYWKLRRMRGPHLQVVAHGQIPSWLARLALACLGAAPASVGNASASFRISTDSRLMASRDCCA